MSPLYVPTDEDTAATETAGGQGFSNVTDVQDARAGQYRAGYTKTRTVSLREEGAVSPRPGRPMPAPEQAENYALHKELREARTAARKLVLWPEDPIDRGLLSGDLQDALHVLWGFRRLRENNWGDLLNILQGIIAGDDLESSARRRANHW